MILKDRNEIESKYPSIVFLSIFENILVRPRKNTNVEI